MHQGKFKIISNNKLTRDCYKLTILAPEIAKNARPGQFVHIRIQNINMPFLRRPFAVHNVKDKETFEILYKIRGVGTKILSSKKKSQMLDIMGPLGNGFDIDGDFKTALIVAGGIGVAPILFLIKELIKKDGNILYFIGASCKDNILCRKDFKNLKIKVVIATEDGSEGIKGKVTDVLEDYLLNNKLTSFSIFASGPKAMLKSMAKISQDHKVSAQLSLDEMIACGVGACLGCAVKAKDGYKLVCKDGPVFKAGDIVWE